MGDIIFPKQKIPSTFSDGLVASNTDSDDKLSLIIQLLLQKGVENPIWYDIAANALRIAGAVTISSGTVTTVTTVGTVTDQTNIGGNPAGLVTTHLADTDWALTTRNLMI